MGKLRTQQTKFNYGELSSTQISALTGVLNGATVYDSTLKRVRTYNSSTGLWDTTLSSADGITSSDTGLILNDGKAFGFTSGSTIGTIQSTVTANSSALVTASGIKDYVDTNISSSIILQGDWDANANNPNITGTTKTGYAWRVSVDGNTNLGGITSWFVGDLAVKTASSWLKVDNHDIKAIWGNITGDLINQSDLYIALSGKESTITAGTSGQWWRGDKTWQTIDTDNTLSANSDSKLSSQKAVKYYVDNAKQILGVVSSSNIEATYPAASNNGKWVVVKYPVANSADGFYLSNGATWVLEMGGTVSSVFGRVGAVVATSGDYTSSLITNASTSSGSTVTDALNTLVTNVASVSGDVSTKASSSITVNGHPLTTNVVVSCGDVGLGNVTNVAQLPLSYLDTDINLTANLDTKVPSQHAVNKYVGGHAELYDFLSGATISGTNTLQATSGTYWTAVPYNGTDTNTSSYSVIFDDNDTTFINGPVTAYSAPFDIWKKFTSGTQILNKFSYVNILRNAGSETRINSFGVFGVNADGSREMLDIVQVTGYLYGSTTASGAVREWDSTNNLWVVNDSFTNSKTLTHIYTTNTKPYVGYGFRVFGYPETHPAYVDFKGYVTTDLSTIDPSKSINKVEEALKFVTVVATSNISLSTLQVIDGITLTANDKVLVVNQATPSQNGVYYSATGNWKRTADFDVGVFVSGKFRIVKSGTAGAGKVYYCTNTRGLDLVGTHDITFSALQISVPVTSVNSYTGPVVLGKSDLGLSNVDNTSDVNKPVSTATQTLLDSKKYYHGVLSRTVGASNPLPTVLTTTTFTSSGSVTPITYYYQGTKVIVNTNKSTTLSGAAGLYYIYFDGATGNLLNGGHPGVSNTSNVLLAAVFWNGSNYGLVYDERHNATRNHEWHAWAHETVGVRYQSGIDFAPTGTAGTSTFTSTAGEIDDEDIHFTFNPSSAFPTANTIRHFWQTGAATYAFDSVPSLRPYRQGTLGRPGYIDSSNSYTFTTLPSATNRYINVFIYGTTDLHTPLYSFTETSTAALIANGYTTPALARATPWPNLAGFGLSPEMKPLYRMLVRADGQIQTITSADDYRTVSSLPQAAGITSTTASSVSFTPYGEISSATVQTGMQDLEDIKISKTLSTLTAKTTGFADSDILPVYDTSLQSMTLGNIKTYVGGGAGATFQVTQASHGKSVGNVIRGDLTNGNATTSSLSEVLGIVTSIDSSSLYTVQTSGKWVTTNTALSSSIVAGDTVYLSDAGGLASTAGTITKELGVRTSDGMVIDIKMGVDLGGTASPTYATTDFLIKSGYSKTSGYPRFLALTSSTGCKIDTNGGVNPLNVVIAGREYTVNADITLTGLSTAPSSNNTCLVNDSAYASQVYTKTEGEFGSTWITIDTEGSSVTALNGTIQVFKYGTEYFMGHLDTTNHKIFAFRRGIGGTLRGTMADNGTITLMKASYIFVKNDGVTTYTTNNYPKYSATAPGSPASGDWWKDETLNVWKNYNGATWSIVNVVYLGFAVLDSSSTVCVEMVDYDLSWSDTAEYTMEYVDAGTIRVSIRKLDIAGTSIINTGYGETVTFSNIDTGSEASSTLYYVYVKPTGAIELSLQCPRPKGKLKGLYKPHDYHRCIGTVYNNSGNDIVPFIFNKDSYQYGVEDTGYAPTTSLVLYELGVVPSFAYWVLAYCEAYTVGSSHSVLCALRGKTNTYSLVVSGGIASDFVGAKIEFMPQNSTTLQKISSGNPRGNYTQGYKGDF